VAEDVSASLEGDWCGQHSVMRCERALDPSCDVFRFPPCLTSRRVNKTNYSAGQPKSTKKHM
jgi:hypothetical protein